MQHWLFGSHLDCLFKWRQTTLRLERNGGIPTCSSIRFIFCIRAGTDI